MWAAVVVIVGVAAAEKAPCVSNERVNTTYAKAMCYSDIPVLYSERGLNLGFGWFGGESPKFQSIEYPPLSVLYMEGSAKLTHALRGEAPDGAAFYWVSAATLAVLGSLALGLLCWMLGPDRSLRFLCVARTTGDRDRLHQLGPVATPPGRGCDRCVARWTPDDHGRVSRSRCGREALPRLAARGAGGAGHPAPKLSVCGRSDRGRRCDLDRREPPRLPAPPRGVARILALQLDTSGRLRIAVVRDEAARPGHPHTGHQRASTSAGCWWPASVSSSSR